MDDHSLNHETSFQPNRPDMLVLVESNSGEITRCNSTLLDTLGYTRDELIGEPEEFLYAQESVDTLHDAREVLQNGESIQSREVALQTADGDQVYASFGATPLIEEGDVVGYQVALRDISNLVETRQKLERQTEKLEKSNEQLEQFAYLASHDLQEPLRMVASYTELLQKRYEDELDERANKYIGYAVDGAKRMKALINDLLQYSRLETGALNYEKLDLNELLDEVEDNLKLKLSENGASLEYDELPTVYGARSQIFRILQNLVDNGIKFQESSPKKVRVHGEQLGDITELHVEDNGIGFDDENADRIFDIFQRVHDRGAYEGTGAGLAVVQKIIDNHEGTIDVASEPGEGTRFTIQLPSQAKKETEGDL